MQPSAVKLSVYVWFLLFVCTCYLYFLTLCLPIGVGCCWSRWWSRWTRQCTPCEEVDLSKGSCTLLSGEPSLCLGYENFAWAARLVRKLMCISAVVCVLQNGCVTLVSLTRGGLPLS